MKHVARALLMSLVALSFLVTPGMASARTKVLKPVFMLKAPNTTPQQTEAALRRALAGRHWLITRDQPGDIEARLHVRDHSVTVGFSWTATQISATYVASENMDYEVDGDKTYIDRYYYRWLKFLQRDVKAFSQRAMGDDALSAPAADGNQDDDSDDPPAAK